MALKHCFSGTNGVPSQRIGKAAPQPAAGKVACALSGPLWELLRTAAPAEALTSVPLLHPATVVPWLARSSAKGA